jgi:hypothetical protein
MNLDMVITLKIIASKSLLSISDRASTLKKVVICNSKEMNIKKGPLNSTAVTKQSRTAQDELNTESPYKVLEAVISNYSIIVGRISSTTCRNISALTNNGDSGVLDLNNDQDILLPSLS